MFWTVWMRTICKIILGIMISVVVITGFAIMGVNVGLGFIVLIGGTIISITSLGMILMISEISVSLDELKDMLNDKNKREIPQNANVITSNAKSNILRVNYQPTPKDSWLCECGTRNSGASTICKGCEKDREKTWVCNNCGKENEIFQSRCYFCDKEHVFEE